MQWGDEVLVDDALLATVQCGSSGECVKRSADFLLLMDRASGCCIALTDKEAAQLSA
jgi:hypothetical protein